MIRASKDYKKTINKAIKEHKSTVINQLKKLRKSAPKEYWKILSGRKPKEKCPINIEEFLAHFKDLGNAGEGEDILADELIHVQSNESLNVEFTQDEIAKAIKRLPNNKSPGIDNILNEYIKATADMLVPLYVKLFNYILDVGEVPREVGGHDTSYL